MKRILTCLLVLLLPLCACGGSVTPTATTNTSNSTYVHGSGGLFPLYVIDESNVLWRVQFGNYFSTEQTVIYSVNGVSCSIVHYLQSSDAVVIAQDVRKEDGKTLCTLRLVGENGVETLAENVQFSSVQFSSSDALLFLDAKDNLYLRQYETLKLLAAGVAQAEFCGDDQLLYRLSSGDYTNNEFSYPVYTASMDKQDYVGQALYLAAADSVNGKVCLVRNKHTITKRSNSVTVADCAFFSAGDGILFELKNVVLSQLESTNCLLFLLVAREDSPSLICDLYRVDGAEPVILDSQVLKGKYISTDHTVYAYEVLSDTDDASIRVIDYLQKKVSLPADPGITLEHLLYNAPYVYYLTGNTVFCSLLANNAQPQALLKNVFEMYQASDQVICYLPTENDRLFQVYTLSAGKETLLTGSALYPGRFDWVDDTLYYYSYDETGEDANYVNISRVSPGTDARVCLWGVNPDSGFLTKGTVIATIADTGKGSRLMLAYADGSSKTISITAKMIINGNYMTGG